MLEPNKNSVNSVLPGKSESYNESGRKSRGDPSPSRESHCFTPGVYSLVIFLPHELVQLKEVQYAEALGGEREVEEGRITR